MATTSKTAHPDRERLFLLDGMALAYRAYFSFINNPLINSRGENTSAIYGFVTTLLKILNEDKPEHLAVAFDTREATFRHVMYQPYKATRQKMPEEMSAQMDKMKQVILAFNVPLIELPGYEADDIIGTLARRAEREGVQSFLVTGDKDFMQLISPLIRMYKPGKRGDEWEILDETAVEAKFGVTPDRVIDVLGLIGDKSDNVPGVPGIGEKTAIPLVQKFGSMEEIYKHLDAIPQKGVQNKLREFHDKALLSKKLVTIDINVPVSINIHELKAKEWDRKKLLELFTELEFRSLIRKFSEPAPAAAAAPKEPSETLFTEPADQSVEFDVSKLELADIRTVEHEYRIVRSEKELKALVAKLRAAGEFVFDTETSSKNPLIAELIGLSFAIKPFDAWYVPVRSSGEYSEEGSIHASHYEDCITPAQMRKILAPLFADASVRKIGQNIKFDMLALAAQGMNVRGVAFDTMIANYILRPDGQHGMDALAVEHLRYKAISYDDLTGTGRNRKELREIEVEKIAEYAAEDADVTWRLYEALNRKLREQELEKLYSGIEAPLIDVLASMELTGVKLDQDFLREFSKELERNLEQLKTRIYAVSGEHFNINSTQQLGRILFEKLHLPSVRKTKTGLSTDIGVLESLQGKHEIIDYLLEYRQLQKLKSTYADALTSLINPKTGRVHTSFNQTVAVTGRLSSSDPNLQNIPIKTELGRKIRQAFIPADPGMKMLAADYSQIELRLMAHVSGDEGLREAFLKGEDIHATTAAKVFGVLKDQITREMRRKAKEVNFGIMYGIGPYGLATRLGIGQNEAKEIIRTYFARFPKVQQYIADTLFTARANGYVVTLMGRRRFLPDINSRNQNVRGNAERQAINMPIQGSAADMIKIAMIDIHRAIAERKLATKMLLQVHDELVFEVPDAEIDIARKLIIDKMKNAMKLSVPIEVDCGTGRNWFEAH